jgi:hypothetical protein
MVCQKILFFVCGDNVEFEVSSCFLEEMQTKLLFWQVLQLKKRIMDLHDIPRFLSLVINT